MDALQEILVRKQVLLSTCEMQRNDLARHLRACHERTEPARRVKAILTNPMVLAGLGLLAWKMPWKRVLGMSSLAW